MTVATQEPVQAKPRTASRRHWLLPAAATILLTLFIGGIILAFHWPFSSHQVIQSVQEDWPGKITVQSFRRTYFPHPGCVLEDVALTRGSDTSGPPLVAIQRVSIQANYHDLLLRPGYISTIILEGLKISVPEQNTSRQASQSSKSSTRIGEVFTRDAILEIAQKDDGPLKFEIHQLSLKSVSANSPMAFDLAMRNPEPPGEIRSHGNLGPWDRRHMNDIPLSGSYTFDGADLGVFKGIGGILAATGDFHGVLGRIDTQGTTDTPKFEVTRSHHAVALKAKFSASVDGMNGDTTLHSVDGSFLKTSVHAEGSVAGKPGHPGKITSVNLTVRKGRIDDVLWLFVRANKAPMEGAANLHAHAVWPSGHEPFLKRLVLQGDFEIEPAQFSKPERQESINTLSKKASGKKKDPDNPNVTADLKGSVLLSNEIAKFQDTSFKVPGAEAILSGTYNLENTKIDFHGDLKTEASLSEDSSGVKAVLLKPLDPLFKKKHAGAEVPVEMTGTYSNPHFGVSLQPKK
ncbi:MAG TPA: AsmA-like C-terminal region-containing protein [Candidatus Acidoferrum sp.]|nr:AsmA-like C-terminal region-containing protein [Candidatus Acidoferrum sp.]